MAAALSLAGGSTAPAQDRSGPVVTTLTIFAGTESGLWRSTDWGYHWERVQGASGGEIGRASCRERV